MRGVRLAIAVSMACLGCRFDLPPGTGDPGGGDAGNTESDAPQQHVPLCMTDPSYTAHPRTGRRYRVMPAAVNYDAAIDQCAAAGAHLAVIGGASENADLVGLLAGTNEGWLGFDDLTEEGTFRWLAGTSTHNAFSGGEPNNTNNEDCTAIRPSGTWHDVGCESQHLPICECDPTYQAPPTPACRTMTASSFEASGRRVFRGPAATWADAKAACEAIGAHLLVLGDLAENTEVDGQLAGDHWLGFTDAVVEGSFRWVNDAPVTFRNWSGGGGDPIDDARDCTVLMDLGAWRSFSCDEQHPYACECDPAPP